MQLSLSRAELEDSGGGGVLWFVRISSWHDNRSGLRQLCVECRLSVKELCSEWGVERCVDRISVLIIHEGFTGFYSMTAVAVSLMEQTCALNYRDFSLRPIFRSVSCCRSGVA